MRKNKTNTKVYGSFSDSFYYGITEGTYAINKKNEERVYKYRAKLKKKRKAKRKKQASNNL